jgi:hypothetical protein
MPGLESRDAAIGFALLDPLIPAMNYLDHRLL